MGSKIAKYSFIPKENEQIDAVITVAEEPRSVIHGVVKDEKGKYVKDAVVKLFLAKDPESCCDLKPITHTFTDECGQFIFGPLTPGKKYVIKVWVNETKICRVNETQDTTEEWDQIGLDVPPKSPPHSKTRVAVKDSEHPDRYYFK